MSEQPPRDPEEQPQGPTYNPPPQGYPPSHGYPPPQGAPPPQGYPPPSEYPPPQGAPPPGYPPPQGAPPPGYPPPAGYPPPYPLAHPPPFGSPGAPGSQEERNWAMLCHLAALSGFIVPLFGSIVGPLIAWLVKRDVWPLVDDQGKEALNFQLSVLLYGVVSFFLIFLFFLGFLLLFALAIFDFVMVILAAVEANKGRAYRYPLCIRFVR